MWTREHVIHAAADPALVWRRWSDPSLWPEDDPGVVEGGLHRPVAVGVAGWTQPRRGPRALLIVRRAEEPLRLDLESPLPGAVLRIEHEQEVVAGVTTRITHRVRFTGPAARLWRTLIGNPIADGLPVTMRSILEHAQPAVPEDPQTGPDQRGQSGVRRARGPRPSKGTTVPVSVNLDSLLDKAYENSTLAEILAAPVDALAGVSASDAAALKSAFNIATVADLGRNKYFAAAVTLHELSEAGAK